MSVSVSGLTKAFVRDRPVLSDVSFEVAAGEFAVIVGPSGSGKSTLLRCIAGLEKADAGRVLVGGRDVTEIDPGERDVAMVFQDHALFPHLDVRTNIAFSLMARKLAAQEIDERVRAAADRLDIGELLDRRPGELSGGERRRVSLARAVVRKPAAFLMDEPLSNLDASLKMRVESEIRSLQAEVGVTTLYVTHDQSEAMTLGRRLIVLRTGRMEQVGTPIEIFDSPANTFVASFMGRYPMNLIPAPTLGVDGAATVGIRPDHLVPRSDGALSGPVVAIDNLGADVIVEFDLTGSDGTTVLARVPRRQTPQVGETVSFEPDEGHLHLFDEAGVRRP